MGEEQRNISTRLLNDVMRERDRVEQAHHTITFLSCIVGVFLVTMLILAVFYLNKERQKIALLRRTTARLRRTIAGEAKEHAARAEMERISKEYEELVATVSELHQQAYTLFVSASTSVSAE